MIVASLSPGHVEPSALNAPYSTRLAIAIPGTVTCTTSRREEPEGCGGQHGCVPT